MRRSNLLMFSLAGLLGATAIALADPPASGTPSATAPATDPGDQVVCHAGQAPIGTRIPGPRVCRTQKEWDNIRQQDQSLTLENQTRGLQHSPPGN